MWWELRYSSCGHAWAKACGNEKMHGVIRKWWGNDEEILCGEGTSSLTPYELVWEIKEWGKEQENGNDSRTHNNHAI